MVVSSLPRTSGGIEDAAARGRWMRAVTGDPVVVALIAELTSTVGGRDEVARLLTDYRDRVRQEPGNLAFSPAVARDDPRSFVVYEEYRDASAFRAHLDSPHNDAFNRAVEPYLEGGSARLRLLEPLGQESADG